MQLMLWVAQPQETLAQACRQQLLQHGIDSHLQVVEAINPKFLRQHPELALILDGHGLHLAAAGMKMQPDWIGQLARLKRASHKNELLARACQTEQQPILIDATAGLGHDGLLLAWLGAKVTLIERHPVLFSLLQDSFQRAIQSPELMPVMQRIQLVHADARVYLQQLQQQDEQHVDVIYLDPMFPKGGHKDQKKQALVKKEMQVLHQLLPEHGAMDLGEYLLPLAQQLAGRVIVKRPRHAPALTDAKPQHQWLGDACRFDGYFQSARMQTSEQNTGVLPE